MLLYAKVLLDLTVRNRIYTSHHSDMRINTYDRIAVMH